MAGRVGGVAPGGRFKAVLLYKNAALGQRLRVADDGPDRLQRRARHAQQVLPDRQVAHPGNDNIGVGVQQVEHGGDIARVGVFKRQNAELCIPVLHGVKDLAPGGAGRLPRKGEKAAQRNVAPRTGHALVGGGIAAQPGALVCAGNAHGIAEKGAVVGAQRLVGDAGRVFVKHSGLPRGIKNRLAGLGLVAHHIGHRAHTPLKQSGHLGINGVDLGTGLL